MRQLLDNEIRLKIEERVIRDDDEIYEVETSIEIIPFLVINTKPLSIGNSTGPIIINRLSYTKYDEKEILYDKVDDFVVIFDDVYRNAIVRYGQLKHVLAHDNTYNVIKAAIEKELIYREL